jgi:small conductance mechanosensitive channel
MIYYQSRPGNLWPTLNLDQQAKLNLITFPILASAQIATWLIGSAGILQSFAQTRALGVWLVRVPISLILIPVGLTIVYPLAESFVYWRLNQYFEWIEERKGPNPRLQQRLKTLGKINRELLKYIFILIGILLFAYFIKALSVFLIVIAAIAYLSQELIKDALQTFFILFEDQYALGDWIQIGDISGQVERISLRATQLRGFNQDLYTISNSSFTKVTNSTRQRSGLHLNIDVTHNTNLDEAITVIDRVIMDLYDSAEWGKYITEKPHVLGIDAIGESSLTIGLVVVTEPGQQWAVGREFRHRLKVAFDQAGIEVASPKRSVWLMRSSGQPPKPPEDQNTDDIPLGP